MNVYSVINSIIANPCCLDLLIVFLLEKPGENVCPDPYLEFKAASYYTFPSKSQVFRLCGLTHFCDFFQFHCSPITSTDST